MKLYDKQVLRKEIERAWVGREDDLVLARKFLSGSAGCDRYVVGLNQQSEDLISSLDIRGVVFDGDNAPAQWCGVPVVKSSNIPPGAIVANCSTSIAPVDVVERIKGLGRIDVVNIYEIIRASENGMAWPWFVNEQRISVEGDLDGWLNLFELLEDGDSRKTLMDVMRYRLTANPGYMVDYRVRLEEQYFEEFMNYKNEVFVDAGGFDGDTAEGFCRRYPDYHEILLFEPSRKNMDDAKRRLKGYENISFFEVGLSDTFGKLHFNADRGSASAIVSGGGETIDVGTLDGLTDKRISFIKMDLEGWELKALKGCENTIGKYRPKMAISVYHSAKDFLDIPRYILALNPSYKVRLRHYTQGWSETVMYFY